MGVARHLPSLSEPAVIPQWVIETTCWGFYVEFYSEYCGKTTIMRSERIRSASTGINPTIAGGGEQPSQPRSLKDHFEYTCFFLSTPSLLTFVSNLIIRGAASVPIIRPVFQRRKRRVLLIRGRALGPTHGAAFRRHSPRPLRGPLSSPINVPPPSTLHFSE